MIPDLFKQLQPSHVKVLYRIMLRYASAAQGYDRRAFRDVVKLHRPDFDKFMRLAKLTKDNHVDEQTFQELTLRLSNTLQIYSAAATSPGRMHDLIKSLSDFTYFYHPSLDVKRAYSNLPPSAKRLKRTETARKYIFNPLQESIWMIQARHRILFNPDVLLTGKKKE